MPEATASDSVPAPSSRPTSTPDSTGDSNGGSNGGPKADSKSGRTEDVKHSVKMMADRILARPSDEIGERKSRAGILIPATANVDRRLHWASVVAVGPTVRNVQEGDRVLFAPDSGYEVEIRGDDYLILRERDVHATASDRSEAETGLYL